MLASKMILKPEQTKPHIGVFLSENTVAFISHRLYLCSALPT